MRTRVVPLVLLPVLALPATACGADDADPLELVVAAAAGTVDDGVARMVSTTEVRAGSRRTSVALEGVVDFEGDRASLTTQLPQERGGLEVVADGTTVYFRSAEVAAQYELTTPWASIDFERMGQATGTALGQLRSSGEAAAGLELLGGAEEVEELGHEEVAGTEAVRYRATVDLRKAVQQAGAITDRARFEQFIDRLGDEDVDVDVWLDADDRVRRLRYRQPGPRQDLSVTVTVDLSDFGADERVEVPRDEEATDLTDRVLREAEAPTA